MRAAVQSIYGTPDVLTTIETERPAIGDHEVLVAVIASPVTQGDRRLRSADYPGIGWLAGRLMTGLFRPKHAVPGSMFAGQVEAVGPCVTRFAVGDDVFGSCFHGAHAEYLCVAEDGAIAGMPINLSYVEVILDTFEARNFRHIRASLTARGRYLSLYVTLRLLFHMAVSRLRAGPRAIAGVALGNQEQMQSVRELVEGGALRPVIGRRFGLDELAEAHRFLEAGPVRGSVVVDIRSAQPNTPLATEPEREQRRAASVITPAAHVPA